MARFGYKLMTEEHGAKAIVANAVAAEAAGFDFVSISDHFHPWHRTQGHAGFAWAMLGAIAHATSRIGITTGLTCPIIRYHPIVIAQAAATIAVMSDDRFSLAVGAGERLNEHVTGARWPSIPERHAMLGEAIDICRKFWGGGAHSWIGQHYQIDHAQIFELPSQPITITVGVSGPKSIELAHEKADGIMATEAEPAIVETYTGLGGTGPKYAEVPMAYAASEAEGLALAREKFAFSAFDWSVNSELPTVEGFDAASKHLRPGDFAETISAGPDPEVHLAAIRKYLDCGYDHIVLTGIGPDQEGFIRFCERELRPKLG